MSDSRTSNQKLRALVDRAVEVLQRHIPPDGLPDHDALLELYGIFDGPDYRVAIAAYDAERATVEPSVITDLLAYGYAPGNYTSHCIECDQNMDSVDKRCRVCKPCAERRRDRAVSPPKTDWRCFHCGDVFTDEQSARDHFGPNQGSDPACAIDITEYRRMEEVNRGHCAEDTELHRALDAKSAEMMRAVRQAEEEGYNKGLQDGRASEPPDVLRDAERYRYIRSDACGLTLTEDLLFGDRLDMAIDTEMSRAVLTKGIAP